MKEHVRYTASVVMAYLLSLTLFLLITAILLSSTLLSKSYHIRQLSASGFADLAAEELREEYTSIAAASGIEASVLTDFIHTDIVHGASRAALGNLFAKESEYDYQGYRDDIMAALTDYVQSVGYQLDEDIEIGLADLAELCAETLQAYTSSFVYEVAVPYILRLQRPLIIITVALAVLSIVLTAVLCIPYRREMSWHYLSCSLAAAALGCGLVVGTVRVSGVLTRLSIEPLSYNRLFSGVLDGAVGVYLTSLAILLPLLAICLVLRFLLMRGRRAA